MIFERHINRYYLRFSPRLLLGIITLVLVDYLQLKIPNLYQLVVNGINDGYILENGLQISFDMAFFAGQNLYAAGADYSVHCFWQIPVAGLLYQYRHRCGKKFAGPDVQPLQGLEL